MPRVRYRTLSSELKKQFGQKVRKLSLNAGFSCPNRDGLLSRLGCSFCAPETYSPAKPLPLSQQIESGIAAGKLRGVHAFIAYFQAYTNTYAPVEKLREVYAHIRNYPEIKGLAIGTRPDCIDQEKLALIDTFANQYAVWLDYGLQSIHPETLLRINRGHGPEAFFRAVALTREFPRLKICVHVILGLPGENQAMELETAKTIAQLKCEGLKLHPLHVVAGTALAENYAAGAYQPLGLEEYARRVIRFLEVSWPETVIHRLTADSLGGKLLAPQWLPEKNAVLAAIRNTMEEQDTWQGKLYHPDLIVPE